MPPGSFSNNNSSSNDSSRDTNLHQPQSHRSTTLSTMATTKTIPAHPQAPTGRTSQPRSQRSSHNPPSSPSSAPPPPTVDRTTIRPIKCFPLHNNPWHYKHNKLRSRTFSGTNTSYLIQLSSG